jgi:hypothetical protein
MTRAATQSWIALLASTSLLVAGSLIAGPAKALTCVSGLPINTIVNTAGGYTCQLGLLEYTFNQSMLELDNPSSYVNFYDSLAYQEISFINTNTTGGAGFDYKVISEYESIDKLELSYTLSPSSPDPVIATITGPDPLIPSPGNPWPPQTNPLTIETDLIPDSSPTTQTLTSMTHKIYKSPAPLPFAGAGLAFGFSRKLRRRALRASSVKRPG